MTGEPPQRRHVRLALLDGLVLLGAHARQLHPCRGRVGPHEDAPFPPGQGRGDGVPPDGHHAARAGSGTRWRRTSWRDVTASIEHVKPGHRRQIATRPTERVKRDGVGLVIIWVSAGHDEQHSGRVSEKKLLEDDVIAKMRFWAQFWEPGQLAGSLLFYLLPAASHSPAGI